MDKNTLTGPPNCKKTTRHNAHLSLWAKTRKTNDAKSRNRQKPPFGQFFNDFETKYLEIPKNSKFFWKMVSFKLKVIFSTNFRPKKSLESFLRKISVSDFGLIWRLFRECLHIKNYFQKSGCDFSTFIVP